MSTIIYHDDLDGKCSAAIVNLLSKSDGWGIINFITVNYKDKLDYSNLSLPIFILDFSLSEEEMQKVIKQRGDNNIFWIDHHATAKNYSYQYLKGLRNFEDKKYAGCELTWMYFFPDKEIPYAVKLIGDYDKWALKYQPACFAFYEGMKLEANGPESEIWKLLFNEKLANNWVETIIQDGNIAIKYRDNYCLGMIKSYGYETEIDGHKAFAMNVQGFGSQSFGQKFKEYPVCISYIHDGSKYMISFYSETVDVGKLAKKVGQECNASSAGGHSGAAGMVVMELPFKKL